VHTKRMLGGRIDTAKERLCTHGHLAQSIKEIALSFVASPFYFDI
jgi:hypothetical protein